MTPERFREVEELYHAVRDKSADERAALLARTDPELRREVESLLAQRAASEFLERPAIRNQLPEDSTVIELPVGASLGPYRIESKLGEGGMGDVYRALDTRLGRAIAIKIVREHFSARFEREARAIASLNHPNICALYDVGTNYLVMELVEGETIGESLKSGPLPVKTAASYALQILAALVEAHEKGIIHRDLKPGNIMIAKSGIKVLDFGLAKSRHDETITGSHVVMGTPAYMAPEQREGKPADVRSDIYSFGCVLYEMLTGARVASQRRRISSRKLEFIVNRCLEENPARRWQDAVALQRELSNLSGSTGRTRLDVMPNNPAARPTVVLADFANATGDSSLDGALRHILTVHLENSPRLSLLPHARVSQTLGLMGQPPNEMITPELAAEVCQRTASAAVVEGSIATLGGGYLLSLRARNCQTGEVLRQEQAQAASKEDAFAVLARIAKRFARYELPTVEREPSLPAEVTTPSREAWRSYSAAMREFQARAQSAESASLLKRAIECDPKFAMAYATLGRVHADLGETELAAQDVAKAYELREGVSDWENYYITFTYHRQLTRNLELCRQTLESWTRKYPKDLHPHGFLSGFTSPGTGHHHRAVEEGLKAIELDPDFAIGYENVAFAYLYLDRLGDAEALLHKAAERKIEVVQFSLLRYFIAFLQKDKAAMETETAQRQRKLEAQGGFEHQEAMTLAYHGRLKEADGLSARAVSLSRQAGLPGRAAMFQGAAALWNALFGKRAEAQACVTVALSLFRSRDADYGPAFALALLQDSAEANSIARELEQHYPQDTSVQFSYVPTLRALEVLNQDDPTTALKMTQAAAPYDLAVPGTAYFTGASFFGALYAVYVRGLAYSRVGRYHDAAAEFQKILDHPGLVLNDPIGPMARLQLARALSASGDRTRSAAVYHDVVAIWKDADADLPIVKEAKAEFEKLK